MARRVPRAALTAALAAAVSIAALGRATPAAAQADATAIDAPIARYEESFEVKAPPLLVRFSFDDEEPVTGPDTIAVFEHARGRVRLSREIVRSGWRSLLLRDAPGDGDFPELQAYFPVRRRGRVSLRFALLVTDPREELNVALAGPGGFGLGKDGIALWIATRDGFLTHVSDSIPRKLAEIRPFVWYDVYAVYSIDEGRYALRITEEGRPEPIVEIVQQPNAASRPGSAVSLISFIGDNGDDLSNVSYFVDDVELMSDPFKVPGDLVAPGRRHLFVEHLEGYARPLGAAPTCPQAWSLDDLGLPSVAGKGGVAEVLAAATGAPGKTGRTDTGVDPIRPRDLEAARRWREGCAALAREDFGTATKEFAEAVRTSDGAFVYRVALATALLGAKKLDSAEALVADLRAARPDDPRVATLAARLASARGFAGEAEAWLRQAVSEAGSATELEQTAAGAFHWLMREKRYGEAESFAAMMEKRHLPREAPASEASNEPTLDAPARARWTELQGDAAFAAKEPARAGDLYRAARGLDSARSWALDLKLADVAFLLGDLETERRLRESIYGALRAEE